MALSKEQILGKIGRRPPGLGVDGAAMIERLGRGRDLRHRMTWPGGSLEIELQVLSRAEKAAAYAAAVTACAAIGLDGKSMNTRAVEAMVDEEYTQILARSIRDPGTHEPIFASAADLAAIATDDELVILFNAYADHQHAVDPEPDAIPAEELAEIDAAIKKKDESRLNAIVSTLPKPWLRTTALRLGTLLMHSSMSTSDSPTPPSHDPAE